MYNASLHQHRGKSRITFRFLLAIYFPTFALLATVGLAAKYLHINYGMFTRDPAHITNMPFYMGLMSNLGVVVWGAGAVLAWFAASVLPRTPAFREQRLFFFWSGVLTCYLMFDDLLMLHDDIFRAVFHTYEQTILLSYLPFLALYLIRFRRQLFRADVSLFLLAAAFLATSFILDQWHLLLRIFGYMILPNNELLEDGAKLLCQVTWMGYLARRTAEAVRLLPPVPLEAPSAASPPATIDAKVTASS